MMVRSPVCDRITASQSAVFAMNRVKRRVTLGDALGQLTGSELDINLVREVYAEIADITNEDEKPTREASRRAEDWLRA
jgi:hypothetical protein